MKNDKQIIPAVNQEIIEQSGATELLEKIRPEWKAKDLIHRVQRLMKVDPSSACQRLFNASIHDLKEKIIIAGLDIAQEVASSHALPRASKPEDIENYSVSRTIELAYYMGLLSRPEWRRMLRVYDIRKDLEHEDNDYEAGIEDCVYIFKTTIDVVLSRDPVRLLKLTDVKEIVEKPVPVVLGETVISDYSHAPNMRQLEIYKFLISTSLNQQHPEIVKQNSFNVLLILRPYTNNQVIIDCSNDFVERLKRNPPTFSEARVANAAGIFPYLKKTIFADFFKALYGKFEEVGYGFKKNQSHGELLRNFMEIGGLEFCPEELLIQFVEWLILCYLGESSFGPYSSSRKVFFSNIGAPLSLEILKTSHRVTKKLIHDIASRSRNVRSAKNYQYVDRRFQEIIDEIKRE
ncbi:MAG TPA: hypothetical protein PLD91_19110 [Spirochaetota bacterium]|nr:hypothetical protein [Spirochaetota bacterium]